MKKMFLSCYMHIRNFYLFLSRNCCHVEKHGYVFRETDTKYQMKPSDKN